MVAHFLGSGDRRAAGGQADHQPILLWAMNGHPLACT
jgi:hypothetical protein